MLTLLGMILQVNFIFFNKVTFLTINKSNIYRAVIKKKVAYAASIGKRQDQKKRYMLAVAKAST